MATTSDGMSDYLEAAALSHFLAGGEITSPSSLLLKLFNADPGEDGSNTSAEIGNIGAPGYVAQAIATANVSVVPDGTGHAATLTTLVEFEATADWSIGEDPTWMGLYDNSGNLLFRGELDPITYSDMTTGKKLQFEPGSLKFKIS